MKVLKSLLFIVLFFSVVAGKIQAQQAVAKEDIKGTITISGAWALYPMVVKWAEEFQKIHPDVKIDVSAGGAGKGMTDALAKLVDIGMISREINAAEIEKGAFWVSVVKDAVVPTVNESIPFLKELVDKGVKRETFIGIWVSGKINNWGEVISSSATDSIHVYTRSDACGAADTWAAYLDKKQEDLIGVGVYGDPGIAEAVKKDIFGIGYNNINYAYDANTKKPVLGIRVLPIDLNNDGAIDKDEDFYATRDDIITAIATGKYPSPPSRALHFVSQGKPNKKIVVEFIRWVLTDGQKYVPESGYINLRDETLKQELKKLDRL